MGTEAAAPARLRGRRCSATAKPAGGSRSSPSLNDQVLALATGKTQQEIAAACKGARLNHVGAAIARHKRAGRVEERDGKLYATQPKKCGNAPLLGYTDRLVEAAPMPEQTGQSARGLARELAAED